MTPAHPFITRLPPRGAAATLLLLSFLSGCAPVSPTAEQDRARFERLCSAPDRNFVKRGPEAAGFAEGPENAGTFLCSATGRPIKRLVEEGFRYYECFDEPWKHRARQPLRVLRIELKELGDPACDHPWLQQENTLARREYKNRPRLKGKCLGAEERSVPESRFVVLHGGGAVAEDGSHLDGMPESWHETVGAISYVRDRILDQFSGEIIAEQINYRYYSIGSDYGDIADREECAQSWSDITGFIWPKTDEN